MTAPLASMRGVFKGVRGGAENSLKPSRDLFEACPKGELNQFSCYKILSFRQKKLTT